MSWPTTDDGLWYIFDGKVFMPVGPSTGAPVLMLRPQGGIAQGMPAVADGPPGAAAALQTGPIPFTELAHSDPTPGGISVTEVSPGLYALSGALHSGADGASGTTSIDLTTIGGTPVAGQLIKVNSSANGFVFTPLPIAERYVAASIADTAAGNAISLLTTIPIPNKLFDYRVMVTGHTIVTQNGGSNVVVNLVAHLGTAGGNTIAQCDGIGGTERLLFSSAPPAGAADLFDRVPAGSGTTNVYIRTEQVSGSNTYTTSHTTSRFAAWAIPIG